MESSSQLSSAWEVYPRLDQLDASIFGAAEAAGITSVQAQLLYNRGLKTVSEMSAFIRASYQQTRDPLTLIDMPRALARIRQALDQQEHITVYGDYDADGVTSSALLYRALRQLKRPGAILDYHIPNRLRDGCGLNLAALDMLKERGTQLIITTDCASSDVEQVKYANQLEIDVIITDHHHPPAELPTAYAMVNPWRPDSQYGERYLCGVGIAFKLTQALYRAYNRPENDEQALLDLVAIGTVADIAPLLGENHTYVRMGLERLNTTDKPGLRALIRNANLQPGKIRERDIAFGIAPCINAAGRMKEASIAFELMVTDDPAEADQIADDLRQLNLQRQQETETLMRHVREQAANNPDHAVVMVDGNDWHEGIIGLVAGKLAEELSKPVLVLSNDLKTGFSRGSARSQKGFNIIEALRGFASQLERYGGHAQAAGFTIASKRIDLLRGHLLEWKKNGGPAEKPAMIEGTDLPDPTGIVTEQESSETAPALMPRMIDLTLTQSRFLNYAAYEKLRELAPFGAGNPEPIFKMEKVNLLGIRTSGPNRQNLLFRLAFSQPENQQRHDWILNGIYTRGAAELPRFKNVHAVNIIFHLNASENDNKTETWLKILDVQPSL
ncbi:single-stranded-DNA-specific exonuclease RecJ [Dictyobacter aurantiacus]|uniref:Single-stranded-DNA-specific exonuclease RecJ n=1 Tax=Dictyobacter aurantiacus TaxID=1936993 RepID=A0A401ZCA7_9CHLR|nr:single-stranded-DNA-specific exonuclease RecJ [Dictyobacter aurantiacus]GCE04531.1 single-stranded-DNA-specific exonuclease RecJ [Dictyobacter aurantiacus]